MAISCPVGILFGTIAVNAATYYRRGRAVDAGLLIIRAEDWTMRRSILLAVLLAILAAGCAEKPPTFKNDPDELRYLDNLSNPTPDQRTRRQALRDKYKPM